MTTLFMLYEGLASAGPSIFYSSPWHIVLDGIVMLIAIFVALSGYFKLRDNSSLALSVMASGVVPKRFTYQVVKIIPIAEIVIGILTLIHRIFTPLLACSFFVFTIITAILFVKKYDGDCGCFGPWFKTTASMLHVLINAAITVFLAIVSMGVYFK